MIHTITGKNIENDQTRCFGYEEDLEDAICDVELNRSDLHECLYDVIFIEAIKDGLFRHAELKACYLWDKKEHKWVKGDVPEKFKDHTNFGIG